jgi:hypothetical protein
MPRTPQLTPWPRSWPTPGSTAQPRPPPSLPTARFGGRTSWSAPTAPADSVSLQHPRESSISDRKASKFSRFDFAKISWLFVDLCEAWGGQVKRVVADFTVVRDTGLWVGREAWVDAFAEGWERLLTLELRQAPMCVGLKLQSKLTLKIPSEVSMQWVRLTWNSSRLPLML